MPKNDDTPAPVPTADEIAAAQAVMQRAAEAERAKLAERLKPIRDIVAMPEYGTLRTALEALPPEFMADMAIAPHIMAARTGLTGLASVAPAEPLNVPTGAPVV